MTGDRVPRVAILVLDHNGLELTRDCLQSLRTLEYPNVRVLVLDNGSARDEAAILQAEFGDLAEVVRGEVASGFCAGNNRLMRRALELDADYVLLLNNDTIVTPGFLGPLVALIESHPKVGVVGPKILAARDRTSLDSVGGVLNLWLARHGRINRIYDLPRTNLGYITGCAFMVRREIVERVGGLDERYYAYWEEIDWCLRMQHAGWTVACEPRSVIYHKGQQTNVHLSNFYIYYMIRNGFLCLRSNGRWVQWPSFTLAFFGGTIARYVAYLLVTRPRDLPIVFEALADVVRGRFGRKPFEAPPPPSEIAVSEAPAGRSH